MQLFFLNEKIFHKKLFLVFSVIEFESGRFYYKNVSGGVPILLPLLFAGQR